MLNLKKLSRGVTTALAGETKESFTRWLIKKGEHNGPAPLPIKQSKRETIKRIRQCLVRSLLIGRRYLIEDNGLQIQNFNRRMLRITRRNLRLLRTNPHY